MNEAGRKVRILRTNAELQQKELAEKVGLTSQVISNIERGYSEMNMEQAAKLAQFFNVSTDYLWSLPELPDEGKKDVTPEERKLLTAYRKLSEDYRDIIMGDIKKYLIAQGDR